MAARSKDELRPVEFWQEVALNDRREFRRLLLRWSLIFAALCAFVVFFVWWAGAALRFSATRVDATTPPTYRVFGIVRDRATGQPVPFAKVADHHQALPPRFQCVTDHLGHFEMFTVAEPHPITAWALGYQSATVQVGKRWFHWLPSGSQRVDLSLDRESVNR